MISIPTIQNIRRVGRWRLASATLLVFLLASTGRTAESVVQHGIFGRAADGTTIDGFTLINHHGATAKVITYGAILADLRVPDRDGKLASVVHEVTFSESNYARGFPNAGMVPGRVANRIANARFTLDGHDYTLAANNGPHTLHGGRKGFGRVLWTGEPVSSPRGPAVRLMYHSRDGEEGFPGNLDVSVTYTLTEENTLRLDYIATTDQPTPINLTNHAFFNLSNGGDVAGDQLTINASRTTLADRALIPTGKIAPVAGTPLDFTRATAIGARAAELVPSHRYDHNFVLNRAEDARGPTFAARVTDPNSGRVLEVWTTEPGLQLYTSILGTPLPPGQDGFFCLETQHFPDSVHHPEFPSTILRPGQTFRSTTEFRFSTTPATRR
jgi:aldose 1-epimerase